VEECLSNSTHGKILSFGPLYLLSDRGINIAQHGNDDLLYNRCRTGCRRYYSSASIEAEQVTVSIFLPTNRQPHSHRQGRHLTRGGPSPASFPATKPAWRAPSGLLPRLLKRLHLSGASRCACFVLRLIVETPSPAIPGMFTWADDVEE
jgi:hypothetical protein